MKVTVIPIVIGTLGTISKRTKRHRNKSSSRLVWFGSLGFTAYQPF